MDGCKEGALLINYIIVINNHHSMKFFKVRNSRDTLFISKIIIIIEGVKEEGGRKSSSLRGVVTQGTSWKRVLRLEVTCKSVMKVS